MNFHKIVAKCESLQLPSSELKDYLCNPIPLNFDIEIKHMDTERDFPFTVKVAQSYLTVCRFDSNAL